MPPPQQQAATGIVFAGRQSSVRPSSVVNRLTSISREAISLLFGGTCHKYSSRHCWIAFQGQRSEVEVTARLSALVWRREAHVWAALRYPWEERSGECRRAVVEAVQCSWCWQCHEIARQTGAATEVTLCSSTDAAAAAAAADKPASRQSSCIRTHQPHYVMSLQLCQCVALVCPRNNCNNDKRYDRDETDASSPGHTYSLSLRACVRACVCVIDPTAQATHATQFTASSYSLTVTWL